MGLDMYLTAKKYFWSVEKKPRISGIPKGFEVSSVSVEAIYWRKANHIHAWFVKNVQEGKDECQPHDVDHTKLEELLDVCKKVMDDHSLAPQLLPVQSGFFFGGTKYDDWYFQDLKYTVEKIEAVLKGFKDDVWYLEYRSSW
jgi:hypothetical protein